MAHVQATIAMALTHVNTGFSNKCSIACPAKNRSQQALLEALDLGAWVSQTGDFDDCASSQAQSGACAELEQPNTLGRDVFSHLPGMHHKSFGCQFGKQFCRQQVHLPQIRLGRILGHPRPMLHCDTKVGVTVHAMTLNEFDALPGHLGEGMYRL